MTQDIGYREPAHCTALGKVLLASLDEPELSSFFRAAELKAFTGKTLTSLELLKSELKRVRLLGFALDDEEFSLGLRCIAAPIFDESGNARAALSVAGPTSRIPDERVASLGAVVAAAARLVTLEMGGAVGRGA